MRVLITGISGFVGGYLALSLLTQPEATLYGVVRNRAKLLPELVEQVKIFQGDLSDVPFVDGLLTQAKPDVVYHLAGQASVSHAWSDPWQTFQANVLPQLNLLQGIIKHGLAPHFLSVISSKVYGDIPPHQMPITESVVLAPDSPYGVSKAAQDMLAQQYFLSHSLPIIRARPFNHIGPRQTPDFVTASFAKQIAMVEAGLAEPVIYVGNLSAKRDFTDVRDVVAAYRLLMTKGTPGEAYNIGSGQAVSVQHILDTLIDLSHTPITVKQDPARMRPADQPLSYGNIAKIQQSVGWQPEIALVESLAQILDYWRARVKVN